MLISLVVGLSIGSIYGLTSMGLVLTYRISGIFNLAHGAIGMAGTYAFWEMWQGWHWPLPVSLLLALGVVAPVIGGLSHLVIFRWVQGRPIAVALVATIALLVAIQGAVSAGWGTVQRQLPSLFPNRLYRVSESFNLTSEQLGTMLSTAVVGGAMLWFLGRTHLGLQMRGVVDNRSLSALTGSHPERVQVLSWALGAAVATFSGILISPFVELSTTALTLVVIQAMAAAMIGRLRSLPWTYAGGLLLGVLEAMLARYVPSSAAAQGLKVSAAFLVLYAAILLGATVLRFFDGGAAPSRAGSLVAIDPWTRPSRIGPLLVMGLGIAVVVPFMSGYYQVLVAAALISAIAFQGFVLVSGLGGQVLLCQAAFVGIGALMYSRMVAEWRWPVAAAFVIAPLVALAFGLAVSLPAIRISGLPLALLTLAFGLFMDSYVFQSPLFPSGFNGYLVPRPSLFGLDLADPVVFTYVVLVVSVAAGVLVARISAGRTGRVIIGVKNSELAAESFGTSTRNVKVMLFSLSTLLAGVSGVFVALQLQAVASIQFNVMQSLLFLAAGVLGGVGNPQGALTGALLLYLGPQWLGSIGGSEYQQLLFGAGAAAVLMSGRGGIADLVVRPIGALLGERPARATARRSPAAPAGDAVGSERFVADPLQRQWEAVGT